MDGIEWCRRFAVQARSLEIDKTPAASGSLFAGETRVAPWQLRVTKRVNAGALLAVVPYHQACLSTDSAIAARSHPLLPSFRAARRLLHREGLFGTARVAWLAAAGACCLIARNHLGELLAALPKPLRGSDPAALAAVCAMPPRPEAAREVPLLIDEALSAVHDAMHRSAAGGRFTGALPSRELIAHVAQLVLHYHVMLPIRCAPSVPQPINSVVIDAAARTMVRKPLPAGVSAAAALRAGQEGDETPDEDVRLPTVPVVVPLLSGAASHIASPRDATVLLFTSHDEASAQLVENAVGGAAAGDLHAHAVIAITANAALEAGDPVMIAPAGRWDLSRATARRAPRR